MSLLPPGPSKSKVGDVWVDPISADRYIFTGENLDDWEYGWVRWDLESERTAYGRGESAVPPEEEKQP